MSNLDVDEEKYYGMSLDEMMAFTAIRERQEEVASLMRASAAPGRPRLGRVMAAGLRRLADLVDPEGRNGSLTPIAGSR